MMAALTLQEEEILCRVARVGEETWVHWPPIF